MRKKVTALVLAAMLLGLTASTALAGHEWIIDGNPGRLAAAVQTK